MKTCLRYCSPHCKLSPLTDERRAGVFAMIHSKKASLLINKAVATGRRLVHFSPFPRWYTLRMVLLKLKTRNVVDIIFSAYGLGLLPLIGKLFLLNIYQPEA